MLAYELDPCQEAPARERMAQRTSSEAKDLIERAARSVGVSASEFVTAAACREARETLRKSQVTVIGPENAKAFVQAFEATEPTSALVDLMRLHAKVKASRQ